MTSVKIDGVQETLDELEKRLSGAAFQEVVDRALTAGAEKFVVELRSQMEPWKDTGATVKEITLDGPHSDPGGRRYITVRWQGPRNRYRIIHLNEFGTVNNPRPRGKGSISRALRNSERVFNETVRGILEGGI